jgi:hypothetical protein
VNISKKSTSTILKIIKPKKRRAVFFVLFFVLIFCLMHTNVYADPVNNDNSNVFTLDSKGAGFLQGTIGWIMVGVLSIISYFLKLFIDLSANFLDAMLKPDIYNFAQEKMVVNGWIVVRDVCNLFFLLILLFIAICTILKIEKYHAKKTLLMLIIMALLINFSKPIAIFIFDGSQLLMNFFLKTDSSPSSSIAYFSHIADLVYDNSKVTFWGAFKENNSINIAVKSLFNTVFLFVLFVVMIAFAVTLLVRIVAIWILVILSPLAFLAAVVPGLDGFSSTWWNALFKYSYVGPAMAFFIWLSTQLFQSTFIEKIPDSQTVFTMKYFISYMVTIVFLYASLVISQKFGTAFAGAIVGNADKALKWAGKGAAMAPYRAAAGLSRATGVTGGIKQAIGASRFGKYVTKEGRKNAQEERDAGMAEKFGVKGAKDKFNLKKMADRAKKWKDEGILDDENKLREQLATGDKVDKMTAARELAKAGKLENGNQYKAGLDALASSPALLETYKKDAKKKNIHAVIDEEITRTGATGGAAQAIYNTHLDSIKPAELGDQDLDKFRSTPTGPFKAEFSNWANGRLPTIHTGIKNDLAKKLNNKDLADFTTNNWV